MLLFMVIFFLMEVVAFAIILEVFLKHRAVALIYFLAVIKSTKLMGNVSQELPLQTLGWVLFEWVMNIFKIL